MEIVLYPDERLRKKAVDVDPSEIKSVEMEQFLDKMVRLMYERRGEGLAANQVGSDKNLFMYFTKRKEPKVLFNPKIMVKEGKKYSYREGCLSLPNIYADVRRAKRVVVVAYNMEGEEIRQKFDNNESVVVQHEVDHLNGKLFIDRLKGKEFGRIQEQLRTLEDAYDLSDE
jgi:peptide deformylase